MRVGSWASVTYLRYTVLTGPKKSKTALYCWNPALSVFVMLASRKVFQVVAAFTVYCQNFRTRRKCEILAISQIA